MKRFKWIIRCGLVLLPLSTLAQDESANLVQKAKTGHRLGFEIGFHEFFGSTIVPDRVRSIQAVDVYEYDMRSDYYGGCYYGGYDDKSAHAINKAYIGIKYETLFSNNNVGIASGLRFSQLWAQLDHNPKYDYFIWLLRQEGQTSDYLTIRSMKQKNHYLSVPLEIRVFPKRSDRVFKNYFKIGGAFNYLYSTDYKIDFQDPFMSKYTEEVGDNIRKPCMYSAFIFPALGFRWGKNNYPWFNVEFQFPGFLIAQHKHAFVDPNVGFGMQFSLQFPLNKTMQ